MNLKACVIAGWLVAALAAGADETLPRLKVGGEVYSNVTVTSVTATDIYFNHAQGFGNAKLKNLDPELQQHFHFVPAVAGETEKQQLEANTQYRAAVAASKPAPVEPPPADSPTRPESGKPDDIIVPKLYARSFLHQPAPQFVAEKWLTPPPEIAGKFVLVDFWATWCGPCRQSIPHLNALSEKFKDRLVVIGLSDETEAAVRKMTSPKIDYSIAIDTQQRMHRTVEVKAIPHAMLIDPKGIVRFEGMPSYLDEQGLGKLLARYSE